MTASDARFMALALSLGRRGLGRVWPNPAVGCVIVRDGRIVGRGRTADGGRPHAEVVALAQAGAAAQGATAYVTLEPCAHHGQTGPCAEALVTAGIARVVVATGDPNPLVAGKGLAMLRAAGVTVETGLGEAQARADHAGFLRVQTDGRPFLTLKLATTLDGRIATGCGDSKWITGPQARRQVHAMRARHDAVLVGAGTLRADDPGLDVRGLGDVPQPVRVVMASRAELPDDGQLARAARAGAPVWVLHGEGTPPWGETLRCDLSGGRIDPASALRALAGRGITRVFCEGGGQVAASLLAAGLVDELVLFQGGKVVGAEGLPALGVLPRSLMRDAPALRLISQDRIGDDVMQRWQPLD